MISIKKKNTGPFSVYHLDVESAKKRNILITGGNSSGKTRLSWAHAEILQGLGWTVIVFDPTGVHKDGPLKYYQKLREGQTNILKVYGTGIVYDMSSLYIETQIALVDEFCRWLWEDRIESGDRSPVMIYLEEAQLYLRNLKADKVKNITRMLMAGRNIGPVRTTMISPRLANLGVEGVALTGQRYFAFQNEENDNRKVRRMYGKEIMEVVKTLKTGEFIYVNAPEPPTLIKVPEFIPRTTPEIMNARGRGLPLTLIQTIGFILGLAVVYPLLWLILSAL